MFEQNQPNGIGPSKWCQGAKTYCCLAAAPQIGRQILLCVNTRGVISVEEIKFYGFTVSAFQFLPPEDTVKITLDLSENGPVFSALVRMI